MGGVGTKWPLKKSSRDPTGQKPVSEVNSGPSLADYIYDLYSSGNSGSSSTTRKGFEIRRFIVNLVLLERKYASLLSRVETQKESYSLLDMFSYDDETLKVACNDFIYFHPVWDLNAGYRVYANAKFESAVSVLGTLLQFLKENQDRGGVSSFKVCGPAMPPRADMIVVYCENKPAAEEIAKLFLKTPNVFNMPVPEMTSRADNVAGVALGAEPTWQATGLGSHKGRRAEQDARRMGFPEGQARHAPQSFGSLRSEAIAAAILNFKENKGLLGDNFTVFTKFVSVAFRGMGLDPTKPGD